VPAENHEGFVITRLAVNGAVVDVTDPSLGLGALWGISGDKSPLAVLNGMSLRDFSRRLSVSYDDLALIVQTQFINPNAVLIPRLTRLNHALARQLGLDPGRLDTPDGAAIFGGNRVPDGAEPLAMAYAGAGDYAQAAEEYRKLIEANPKYVAAYYHGGQALEKLGKAEEARAIYHRGIEISTQMGDMHARSELEAVLDLLG